MVALYVNCKNGVHKGGGCVVKQMYVSSNHDIFEFWFLALSTFLHASKAIGIMA